MLNNAKFKIILALAVLAALGGLLAEKKIVRAALPALKEGTFLSGQTLSVWPSWSTLGNALGQALPVDPINQLGLAGTCATTTNRFCLSNSQCPSGENCVLHDPETGWSVADRRFSFACSAASYAYRYIAATSGQAYTVRARFEDPGISINNWNNFTAGFISSTLIEINKSSGVCLSGQEISTLQSGVCGDGQLNLNKGEQCDPPGRIEYEDGCVGTIKELTVCNSGCQWVASTTQCSNFSHCGNGVKELGEACDDGAFLNGKYNHCNATCNGVSALGKCGDESVQLAYEICDPHTPGLERYSLTSKNDSCSWDCQNWGPYCGDRTIQTQHGEECDGSQACAVDGKPGVKICAGDCKMSPSATSTAAWLCTATTTPVVAGVSGNCGNGAIDAAEACDRGAANNGLPCVPAYGVPCSYCSADCKNSIDVQPTQYCGNGIIESAEKCEISTDIIYSATSNTLSTGLNKDSEHNGYKELACSAENISKPWVKKGTKTCGGCVLSRSCVTCGLDNINGVTVEGKIINVLQIMADDVNADPLMVAGGTKNRTVGLYLNEAKDLDTCSWEAITPTRRVSNHCINIPPVAKTEISPTAGPKLSSYVLQTPTGTVKTAPINSNSLCSSGDEPNYRLTVNMGFNLDKSFQFPITAVPEAGQYDLLFSPVIKNEGPEARLKDVRVVVSWTGMDEFYGGFIKPVIGSPTVEGSSYYVWPTHGLKYYTQTDSDHKKDGAWYHGLIPGNKNAESFTFDTAEMAGGAYAFYVRTPLEGSIEQLKNSAKLKVDVYIAETAIEGRLFGAPVKTFYLNTAASSDNPNADYWHVLNIAKPSGGSFTEFGIEDVNTIVTGPEQMLIGACTGKSSAEVCRPAASGVACDLAENCTGASDFCPAEQFKASGVSCRSASLALLGCDAVEYCSGLSADCPADSYATAGTDCVDGGKCDGAGVCNNCPSGQFRCSAGGSCQSSKKGQACNDGNPCTENESYQDDCGTASSCYGGTPKNCDDIKSWTADSCDPSTSTGCVWTPKTEECDGNICTGGDAYDLIGRCISGTLKSGCCSTVTPCAERECYTSSCASNSCKYIRVDGCYISP